MKNIVIVDDDVLYIKNLAEYIKLELEDVNIITYSTNINFLLNDKNLIDYDIFVIDKNIFNGKGSNISLRPNTIDGLELAKKIKQLNPKSKVILNSSENDLNYVIEKYNFQIVHE